MEQSGTAFQNIMGRWWNRIPKSDEQLVCNSVRLFIAPKIWSSLKWTILGQIGRSKGLKVGGPKIRRWTVTKVQSGRSSECSITLFLHYSWMQYKLNSLYMNCNFTWPHYMQQKLFELKPWNPWYFWLSIYDQNTLYHQYEFSMNHFVIVEIPGGWKVTAVNHGRWPL